MGLPGVEVLACGLIKYDGNLVPNLDMSVNLQVIKEAIKGDYSWHLKRVI